MASPDPARILLWCAFPEQIRDPAVLSRYRRLLSTAEAARAQRFHFSADRHRYLVTRALVRTVLARYASATAEQLAFPVNAYGRPGLPAVQDGGRRISFNLSHTPEMVILGLSFAHALGVDVENTGRAPAAAASARGFLSAHERADLAALPEPQRQLRYFQYWTLKEAYVKARGMGLSLPMDQCGFRFSPGGGLDMTIAPGLDDAAARWRFWQLRPAPDYLLAVCVERAAGLSQCVSLTQIVPLEGERALDPGLVCASGN